MESNHSQAPSLFNVSYFAAIGGRLCCKTKTFQSLAGAAFAKSGDWAAVSQLMHAPLPALRSGLLPAALPGGGNSGGGGKSNGGDRKQSQPQQPAPAAVASQPGGSASSCGGCFAPTPPLPCAMSAEAIRAVEWMLLDSIANGCVSRGCPDPLFTRRSLRGKNTSPKAAP